MVDECSRYAVTLTRFRHRLTDTELDEEDSKSEDGSVRDEMVEFVSSGLLMTGSGREDVRGARVLGENLPAILRLLEGKSHLRLIPMLCEPRTATQVQDRPRDSGGNAEPLFRR